LRDSSRRLVRVDGDLVALAVHLTVAFVVLFHRERTEGFSWRGLAGRFHPRLREAIRAFKGDRACRRGFARDTASGHVRTKHPLAHRRAPTERSALRSRLQRHPALGPRQRSRNQQARPRNLPPMPDRRTGEPRPPAAPLVDEDSRSADNGNSPTRKAPKTPPGEAAALEWYYPTRTARLVAGLLCTAIGLALYIFQGDFSWLGNIWLWLVLAAPPFIFLLVGRTGKVSAGADWLATSDRDYVKLYELVKVTVHVDGVA